MVELEPPLSLDGQVDVSYVVCARDEANDPGDEKHETLETLQARDAIGDDTTRNQAWKYTKRKII